MYCAAYSNWRAHSIPACSAVQALYVRVTVAVGLRERVEEDLQRRPDEGLAHLPAVLPPLLGVHPRRVWRRASLRAPSRAEPCRSVSPAYSARIHVGPALHVVAQGRGASSPSPTERVDGGSLSSTPPGPVHRVAPARWQARQRWPGRLSSPPSSLGLRPRSAA